MMEFLLYTLFAYTALMCLLSQSPVTAVIHMIALFAFTAMAWIAAGAEFLGILLVIVYVGAVAVLFLFVVMMLNMGRASDLQPFRQRLEFLLIPFSSILVASFCRAVGDFLPFTERLKVDWVDWTVLLGAKTNAEMLGSLFYTNYAHIFFILSLILLLAMVASIVLVLGSGSLRTPRAQDKFVQLDRSLAETIRLRK